MLAFHADRRSKKKQQQWHDVFVPYPHFVYNSRIRVCRTWSWALYGHSVACPYNAYNVYVVSLTYTVGPAFNQIEQIIFALVNLYPGPSCTSASVNSTSQTYPIWLRNTTCLSSSSSKVQSSMVEYHTLVVYGHMTWLSARSNYWCLLWRRRVSQSGSLVLVVCSTYVQLPGKKEYL